MTNTIWKEAKEEKYSKIFYFNYRRSVVARFARKSITIIRIFLYISRVSLFFLYESHARCWRWCVDHDTMLMDFLTFLPPLGRQTDMPHETLTYFFLTKPFFFSDGFWECWEFLRNWNIRRIQEVGTSSCIKIVMRERIDSMEWEWDWKKKKFKHQS